VVNILKNSNTGDVSVVPFARVPIVQYKKFSSDVSVDISFNNLLGVENSILVRNYLMIDNRVAPLVFAIKNWAKLNLIHGAVAGFLSSYAYTLMCIHYLQRLDPPILPFLQEIQKDELSSKLIHGWECKFHLASNNFIGFGEKNTQTLLEIYEGFFRYFYAFQKTDVIAIHSLTTDNIRKSFLNIQDPFELSHNLGKALTAETSQLIFKNLDEMCHLRCDPYAVAHE